MACETLKVYEPQEVIIIIVDIIRMSSMVIDSKEGIIRPQLPEFGQFWDEQVGHRQQRKNH